MSRTRLSAKRAGARFNAEFAAYLAAHVDDRIEVRHVTGANDRADIAAVRHPFTGARIVVECKNWSRPALGTWANETETERVNDGALVGMIAHKRHGVGDPGQQWVTMTADNLVALLTGRRPEPAVTTTPKGQS